MTLKQMLCKHEYEYESTSRMFDGKTNGAENDLPIAIVKFYRCKKCGHVQRVDVTPSSGHHKTGFDIVGRVTIFSLALGVVARIVSAAINYLDQKEITDRINSRTSETVETVEAEEVTDENGGD